MSEQEVESKKYLYARIDGSNRGIDLLTVATISDGEKIDRNKAFRQFRMYPDHASSKLEFEMDGQRVTARIVGSEWVATFPDGHTESKPRSETILKNGRRDPGPDVQMILGPIARFFGLIQVRETDVDPEIAEAQAEIAKLRDAQRKLRESIKAKKEAKKLARGQVVVTKHVPPAPPATQGVMPTKEARAAAHAKKAGK